MEERKNNPDKSFGKSIAGTFIIGYLLINSGILILNEEIIISIIFALFCLAVWKYLNTDPLFSEKIDFIKTAYSKIYFDRRIAAQKNIDSCISVIEGAETKSPSRRKSNDTCDLFFILNSSSISKKEEKGKQNSDQLFIRLKTYRDSSYNNIDKIRKNISYTLYKYYYIEK
jgi:hypothetical protein